MASSYNDLTANLEFWSNTDLIEYIADSELMMGLEKYQVIRLAQELADRFPYDVEFEEEEDEEDESDGRFHGTEDNS